MVPYSPKGPPPDKAARNPLQIVYDHFQGKPLSFDKLGDMLCLPRSQFEQKVSSRHQPGCGLRDQAAIDLQAGFSAEQSQVRFMIPHRAGQTIILRQRNIRRIAQN
jgi:hypothetical protein